MSILEKQLAAQENQSTQGTNTRENSFSPNAFYPYLGPGSDSNSSSNPGLNSDMAFNSNNDNGNGNVNVNPQDIPLTPEILNAFLNGLNTAGFSKQEILDFSANQIGQLQGGQPQQQPRQQQQQQTQQRGFVNPALTNGKGSFGAYNAFDTGSNGFATNGGNHNSGNSSTNNNNLMTMMMMMNQSSTAPNNMQQVNPPNGSYPQPGIHTPEASASSKSNTSSPEAGLGNSPRSPNGSTRQPSGSSTGAGGKEQALARSRRNSQDGAIGGDKNEHKRKAEEGELMGHQSLRRHMGDEGRSRHWNYSYVGNARLTQDFFASLRSIRLFSRGSVGQCSAG